MVKWHGVLDLDLDQRRCAMETGSIVSIVTRKSARLCIINTCRIHGYLEMFKAQAQPVYPDHWQMQNFTFSDEESRAVY